MSVHSIITNLEKLEKMHNSLLELAIKKTEIVKKGDMNELDKMIKSEQSHVAAIELLEKQRKQLVSDYLLNKGVSASKSTIDDLINHIDEEETRNQLQDIRNRLLTIIDDLRVRNELNQKLVFQSLQYVNMTLDMLRPPQQEQINYSNKAMEGPYSTSKKGYFDSKA